MALGAKVDEASFKKAAEIGRITAKQIGKQAMLAGSLVATVITAVTAATAKTLSAFAEQDKELDKTAKKLKKSREEARAYDEALKAMGKTIDEVKRTRPSKRSSISSSKMLCSSSSPPTPLSRLRGFGRYSRSSPVSKWRAPMPSSGLGIT